MKNKLIVFANFNYKERSGDGAYLLVLPQGHTILWGHWCSSLSWAMCDLCFPNSRKEILDDLFGKDNWEFVYYVDFIDEKTFWEFVDETGKNNKQINLEEIDRLKKHYKDNGGSY